VSEVRYPIAETFYSIQGEGVWTGTPMFFVRLAGCNVGKYVDADQFGGVDVKDLSPMELITKDFPLLQDRTHSVCTAHDGTRFLCDTDYHRAEWMTPAQIDSLVHAIKPTPEHVVITGGEPFLYDLEPLVAQLQDTGSDVHIETSGTKPIVGMEGVWVTCSPKEGFLKENMLLVDEWKFLLGPKFTAKGVMDFLQDDECPSPVYLQPINGVNEPDAAAVARTVELVKANPSWRLSAQLHKYLGAR
jgi:7-carboxy-7-deazaguanine synthase